MIDRQALLTDLQNLLKVLEEDLLERSESAEVPEVGQQLRAEYERARSAERTAENYEDWRSDRITQAAAAWVLSCVFARFLEDNQLIEPPRLSGPGERLQHARDQHELYFTAHAKETDREYVLSVFAELASLPGAAEVFGKHNPINELPNWLSGDAAGELLRFFQRIVPDAEDANTLVHNFTDPEWDTRFLGDLYQDLSEAARKRYALLQTPEFVEEFILDRTLEPALDEFGLDAPPVMNEDGVEIAPRGFRMIDPACGSGHFLLGAFRRILDRWRKKEPVAKDRDLVRRTLDCIYGVDINPYAIAIARFRLLLEAMRESGIRRLKDAPDFHFNLAAGDSLLHGPSQIRSKLGASGPQLVMEFHELAHHYHAEDLDLLKRILRPATYHAVVANPPYITVKDNALNQAYRDRYATCHMKYSLAVPFMERIFRLAVQGRVNGQVRPAGFIGQITANSFMKREFGKKLIEEFLPKVDLTHVVDTSLAFIPGHGIPTLILFGRNRPPVSASVRCVMGIERENHEPRIPSQGQVWQSILSLLDVPRSENRYVSVGDTERGFLSKHPWTLVGGGAVQLKQIVDGAACQTLDPMLAYVGFIAITGEDDIYEARDADWRRKRVPFRRFGIGDAIRDWAVAPESTVAFMYGDEDGHLRVRDLSKLDRLHESLWPMRETLRNRLMFGKLPEEAGLSWYEYRFFPVDRFQTPPFIVFTTVSTHNHFVVDRGGIVYKQSVLAAKLERAHGERDYEAVAALLNTSIACFWMRQVFHDKGGGGIGGGIAAEGWERFIALDGTKLKSFPIPSGDLRHHYHRLAALGDARNYLKKEMAAFGSDAVDLREMLATAEKESKAAIMASIARQEELDWEAYHLYGIAGTELCHDGDPPPIELGQRAFEIVMARKMAAGELETTWFDRHGSTPITEIPDHWPEDYRELVERRIEMIESDRNIGLIEQPEHKRRWNVKPWDVQLEQVCRDWLLDRLESYFDCDGRMNGEGRPTAKVDITLISTAALADIAHADEQFMQVGELYRDDPAFDVQVLVDELVAGESVPLLPVCRYKPSGLRKRAEWEKTWELQRQEDELARRRQTAEDAIQNAEKQACALIADDIALAEKLESELKEAEQAFRTDHFRNQRREYSISLENDYLLNVRDQNEDGKRAALRLSEKRRHVEKVLGDVDREKKHLISASPAVAATREALRAIPENPEIAVPPKYTSADFISTGGARYWALRGKLDVPKERWVSFPGCDAQDGTPMIAWAGYDHLQLAKAISAWYVRVQEEFGGSDDPRLEPLLACLIELLPWLKQWHNEPDSAFEGLRMGDHFEGFINEEVRKLGKTVDEIKAWQPPKQTRGRRKKSNRSK